MDKIKTVKIKNEDGSISQESYNISVDAKNVDMLNGKELQETIGNIDIDNDGNISEQLKRLKNKDTDIDNEFNKVCYKEDIVNNLNSEDSDKPLSANMGKVLDKNKFTSLAKLENICALPYRYSGAKGLQGGCYGGNGKVVNYFTSSYTIQVIDLLTGNIDREYSNNNFGHGNGICKIDDFIYLCGTGNMSTNNVYKIPYDTLDSYEIVNVYDENLIPSGFNISCITYNPDNEKVYISIAPVFDTMTIYEFNKELNKIENIYTIGNENKYGGFITNICY